MGKHWWRVVEIVRRFRANNSRFMSAYTSDGIGVLRTCIGFSDDHLSRFTALNDCDIAMDYC